MADPEPERTFRGITKAYHDLADTLESVQDDGAAKAATPELDAQYSRLISLLGKIPELMRKYADKKVSKQRIDDLNRDRQEAESRVKNELERLDRIRGLPAAFWRVVRVKSIDILVAGVEVLQSVQGNVPEEAERAAREEERRGPDPSDPDYHARLAERMASDNPPYRRDALDKLLKIQPSEVPSPETRSQIARAFKDLAFGEDHFPDERQKGIQGMAVWGGQFAVPLLLELLEDDPHFIEDDLYDALGDLQDARAAGPIAARLGNFFEHQKAYQCLRRIGPAAEDALLEVAPSNDPKICLAAVQLLGEVGTAKSYPILREGLRSRNADVKAAAKLALKKVREREQQAEGP